MLSLSYIRWVKAQDPSRLPAETDVLKFLLDTTLRSVGSILVI